MSPRAAARLETLGFAEVYDFAVGEAAWAACGLPTEGALARLARAADAVREGVYTCAIGDGASDACAAMDSAGQQDCIVLSRGGIVLGRSRRPALVASPEVTVEAVMGPGPSTVRPSERLDGLVERMRQHRTASTIVTTLDGKFVGVLYREDAERLLGVENLSSEAD